MMKKENVSWKISKLLDEIELIDFPEFQREPNVWSLEKKQRLIDSIVRGFDVASMYFYRKPDNNRFSYDCIDGRQRINAILSFVGKNKTENSDDNFPLTMRNEIYTDAEQFNRIINKRYNDFEKQEDRDIILDYKINVVEIWDIKPEEELNLLFLRLNLGQILNAGEKLNAMVSDMRDFIFKDIGKHYFFTELSIPYRRFAKEQVAAQVALNYFSKREIQKFHRSRYIDLQDFFKAKDKFNEKDRKFVEEIRQTLDKTCDYLNGKLPYLKSRAVAVSVFFFIQELIDQGKEDEISKFVEFLVILLQTLKWQLPQEVKMDKAYYYLLDFQTYVTQAAGEEYSIRNRHEFLRDNFEFYKKQGAFNGDMEYHQDTGQQAEIARAKIVL
jgi:hypothetical protein